MKHKNKPITLPLQKLILSSWDPYTQAQANTAKSLHVVHQNAGTADDINPDEICLVQIS